MSVRMIVCGAAGRMGRTLVQLIAAADEATLVGAVEARGNSTVGTAAGGCGINREGFGMSEKSSQQPWWLWP